MVLELEEGNRQYRVNIQRELKKIPNISCFILKSILNNFPENSVLRLGNGLSR